MSWIDAPIHLLDAQTQQYQPRINRINIPLYGRGPGVSGGSGHFWRGTPHPHMDAQGPYLDSGELFESSGSATHAV